MKTIVATMSLYLLSALTALANEDCVPLAEQFPDLGTSQSVSASKEFTTVWGSFELPGGPCGYASADEHYNALLEDAEAGASTTYPDLAARLSGHLGYG